MTSHINIGPLSSQASFYLDCLCLCAQSGVYPPNHPFLLVGVRITGERITLWILFTDCLYPDFTYHLINTFYFDRDTFCYWLQLLGCIESFNSESIRAWSRRGYNIIYLHIEINKFTCTWTVPVLNETINISDQLVAWKRTAHPRPNNRDHLSRNT